MGITIPQVVTSDRASGAQVIDGSLNFDENKKYYLERTATDSGSAIYRMTVSWWMKHTKVSGDRFVFNFGSENDLTGWTRFSVQNAGNLNVQGVVGNVRTTALYRDIGWYHYLVSVDTTQSAYNDQVKMYVNGVEIDDWNTTTAFTQNTALSIGENTKHYIGVEVDSNGALRNWLTGTLAQVYVIENQILDASYFGYTDGLTNTWRPKKYEGTFGTNGYYLPMDGSAPIGQDQSGKGNNYTPVNFGGSVSLDNPQVSGARPILNTLLGGTQAGVGVFGSKQNVGYAVTVYDDGGGNKYYIDGVKQDTVTGLIRGATYTFDTSDSTVSSHPFRFSATSNGSHGGGSEYTNGVAAITGAATTITVPHDAPNTLYYYCTSHSGMGADITGITTNEKLADQYASNCVLALPLVGANSDVSASIACTSTTKVMSNVGNAAASSDTSNFYSGSFEFDGTGDGVSTPDNTDFEFGGGDFTVECWVKQDDTSGFDQFVGKYGGSSDGEFIVGKNGNTPTFYWQDSGGNNNINATNFTGNTNSWYHMACVREGNVFTMYINGVCENSTTDATTIKTTSNKLTIGIENDSSSSPFDGYLQDVRIYKGVAKYSGTTVGTQYFVPASTSPDILPDTPSGVSGGSKLTKITEGAVSFDGSGDYLSIADSSDFTVGTNPFTLEFYAYKTAAGEDFFCGSYDSSGTTASLSYAVQTGGSSPTNSLVAHVAEGGSATSVNSGVDFVLNKWVHVAFVRDGNTLRLFQDGIQMSTAAFSGTVNDASNAFEIGRAGFSGKDFPGYISNFRFVNGTALYTANFNPPTRTLTNVTNTKLLCCQSNTLAGSAAVVPGASGINDGTPWSEFVTIPEGRTGTNYNDDASNWFDGDTSTSASLYSGNMVSPYSPTTVVFTPPSPITVSTGVRVYMAVDRGQTILINGTQTNASVSAGWNDTGFTGTLTSLTLGPTNAGSSSNPSALEIDGVILKNLVLPKGNAAATNFNPFNTDIKTVRGQETGYTTWNPLDIQGLDAGDLKDGNLSITHSAGNWLAVRANKFVSSGKWYYEVKVGNNQYTTFGVGSVDYNLVPTSNDWCNVANVYGFYPYNGKVYDAATGRDYATADTSAAGNVYGIAIDMDNKSLRFYENGRDLGVAFDSTTATNFVNKESVAPMAWLYNQSGTDDYNFGQKPFKFPPPAGFQPLNDANVRPSTIVARPDQYVDVRSGLTAQFTISDLDFETNLVIAKSSSHDEYWIWADSVRGFIGGLRSNGTDVEGSGLAIANVNSNGYQSDSNWFTTSRTYVTYSFKAGGSKNTFNVDDVGYASAAAAGITGLDGTGEMTTAKFLGCSIGTKQGFSIIKYRGLGGGNVKVPHGLSQTPNMVIVKNLDSSVDWAITHSGLPGNRSLRFTTASTDTSGFLGLNKGGLASTYFTINFTDTNLKYVNASNEDYVAYIWHDVPGLQKFGSYTGNGSADGTFVETGFRPTLLWIKNTTTNGELWCAHDNKRDPFNPAKQRLELNGSGEQDATQDARIKDFLSNGFKIRGTSGEQNTSGDNYIYCAWAEAPEFNLYGAQSNAR